MKTLITYDVSKRQDEAKRALIDGGFSDRWDENSVTFHLPDATLWHPDVQNAEGGKILFHDVINRLNKEQPAGNLIEVERFMAVVFLSTSGIPGDELN